MPDPNYIMQVASGYGVSRVLLSAVGLGLYTRLASEQAAEEARRAAGLQSEANP